MSPEAEAAKARVLIDRPGTSIRIERNAGQQVLYSIMDDHAFPFFFSEDAVWINADLENNARIVQEKWPDAFCVNDCDTGSYGIIYSGWIYDHVPPVGKTEPEAWLNARKIVRGEV